MTVVQAIRTAGRFLALMLSAVTLGVLVLVKYKSIAVDVWCGIGCLVCFDEAWRTIARFIPEKED